MNDPKDNLPQQTEEAFEARLAGIVESAMDAIVTVGADQRVVLFNRAAEQMFRCPAADALGRPLDRFIPAGFRYAHRGHIRAFGETGVATRSMGGTRAVSGLRADGEEFPVEASISQVEAGGQKLYTVIMRDITERKKVEAQLLRAQRMESIGTLAGGIAHDLNNVLSPILMAVEVLRMKHTDEESQTWLRILNESAQRGAAMVKQVLSFARGTGGERTLLNPKHLLAEFVSIMRETFPKSIEIKFNLPSGLWPVSADVTGLNQVLMNLAVNARDAMPAGGVLTLRAENATVDENYARMRVEAAAGNYVKVTVEDTGVGMTHEVLGRIFDPFFTTKGVGKGTGLGLSTALAILKTHGGFMDVHSEIGRGSSFTAYLPAADIGEQVREEKSKAELPTGKGQLVLVVDDEEAIRQITKGTLEAFGYRVLSAGDGTEAVALYAPMKDEIACVITDMMMPFMDGLATIRALKRLNPAVKIISASGLAEDAKEKEAAGLGVEKFLPKPYTAEALLRALAAILGPSSAN